MKIHSVKLRNIGPFVSRHFDFDGSMIGILGANGAGKSTLFEAVCSGLTGDFRKYPVLSDFVRDEPDKRKAPSGSIILKFSHGRTSASLRRTITVSRRRAGDAFKGTQSAALSLTTPGGTEEITGVEAVNQRITELLGLDTKTLGECAFIAQDAVTGIVKADDASRARTLHRLFGLTRYETVWDVLGKEINAMPVIQMAESVGEIQAELAAAEEELRRVQAQIQHLEKLLREMNVEAAERTLAGWERAGRLREQLADATAREDLCARRVREAKANRDTQAAARDDLRRRLAELTPVFDRATAAIKAVEDSMNLRGQLDQVASSIRDLVQRGNKLVAPVMPQEAWSEQDEIALDDLRAKVSVSVGFVKDHEAFLSGGSTAVCPTCHQPVANITEQVTRHKSIINELAPKLRAGSERRKALQDAHDAYRRDKIKFDQAVRTIKDESVRLSEERTALTSRLERLGAVSDVELVAHRACVTEYNGLVGAERSTAAPMERAEKAVKDAETDFNQATASLKQLRDEIALLDKDLATMTPDQIRALQSTVQLASSYRLELVGHRESARHVDTRVTQIRTRLTRAEVLAERVGRVERVRSILGSARDVFHREQLPMVMARRFLSVINERMAHFLALMQSDFTAELAQADNVYALTCLFSDGTSRPAFNLSGGEKVKFSVAFLLAVNEALAPQLGMLMLDEPTAALNEASVQHLVEPLNEVRSFAANAGVQVIMVTHAQQLAGCFDRTLVLSGGELDDGYDEREAAAA